PAPPPPASPPDVSAEAAAATPAVLAEQETGVRDYRKRLDELKAKNPFKAKFQFTPQEVGEQTAIEEPQPSAGDGGGGGGGGAPSPAPSPPGEPPSSGPQPQPGAPDIRGRL